MPCQESTAASIRSGTVNMSGTDIHEPARQRLQQQPLPQQLQQLQQLLQLQQLVQQLQLQLQQQLQLQLQLQNQ